MLRKSVFNACSLLCLSVLSTSPAHADTISFTVDNDFFVGRDHDYTSGLFFAYASSPKATTEELPMGFLATWLPTLQHSQKTAIFKLGQSLWTPEDLKQKTPEPDQRPYAAVLFVQAALFQQAENQSQQYRLRLGTTGENAKGEEVQNGFHNIGGSTDAQGWGYQIEDQAIIQAAYRFDRLLTLGNQHHKHSVNTSATGRLQVGNDQSEIALSIAARWGSNLNNIVGDIGYTPSNYFNQAALPQTGTGYYVFAGIEARYRANDIYIEGNRPGHYPDMSIKSGQATVVSGIVYYQPRWGSSLTLALTSKEFEQDDDDSSAVGSLNIFYRL